MRRILVTPILAAVLAVSGCGAGDDAEAEGSGGKATSSGSGSGGTTQASTGGTASGSGGTAASSGGSSAGTSNMIPSEVEPGKCGLDNPAFCEDFETISAGGRGGDIDESKWSFARWAHAVQFMWLRTPASTSTEHVFPATFCNEPFNGILPDDDVKICTGTGPDGTTVSNQLNEVFDDEGDFALHSMRVRQPFDFTDRTGTIVWDVDGKVNPLNLGHGWWIEIWITEQPIPIPYHEAPTIAGYPQNGVGLAFQFGGDCPEDSSGAPDSWNTELGWQSSLEVVHVTNKTQILHQFPFWEFPGTSNDTRCYRTADAHQNHFELKISKDRLEIWVSNYDDPASLQLRNVVEPLDLEFSKGYVHFQHGQYNAPKDGHVAPAQTFRWDNLGFDGPAYPTPRSYDVQNNDEVNSLGERLIGWIMADGHTQDFTVHGVDPSGATSAAITFNALLAPLEEITYSVNGGPVHDFTVPEMKDVGGGLHGWTVPVPLEEVVAGDNTFAFTFPPSPDNGQSIGNIDLTLEVP